MSSVRSSTKSEDSSSADRGPIRVLHAIGSISLARGGPSVAIFNTAEALRRRGIACEIVTTDDDGPDRRISGVAFGELTPLQGSLVRFFPLQTDFYSTSLPMFRWLLANVHRYDVVHVHALFNFAPGAAALAAWLKGVPYVVRPCGVLEAWGRHNRRPWLKRNSIRFIEGPLLRRAGAVQFTSRQEQEQAAELPMPARQAVIPLAMPLTAARPCDEADPPEPRFRELNGRPWALYLSRLDPKKGLERLLSAFREVRVRMPAAMLVIAGDGAPDYVASLKLLATELGLHESVRWLGMTVGPSKDWLLANCGAFVLASSSENFGVAAVEAMAAGRPVVVTSGVAISEIVTRWNAGVVTGLEAAEIADGLSRMLGNPEAAREMGAHGRDAVREELSLETHGRRLEALYRALVGAVNTEFAAAS